MVTVKKMSGKESEPILVSARFMLWVCSRQLALIVGSNTAGGTDVCLLWVLCVVRQRFLHHTEHSYLLNPWSRVLLEKQTGFAASQEIPSISRNPKVHHRIHKSRHLSLSWASSIQSPPHPTSRRSILILSSHLRLGLPNGLFPSGFPTRTLCTPISSPIRTNMPRPSHSSRFYHPHNIG